MPGYGPAVGSENCPSGRLDGAARLWLKPHGDLESEHHYQRHDRGFAGDAVFAIQAHIVEHLLEATPLENSGREYLSNLEIVEAIYRPHADERWIGIP